MNYSAKEKEFSKFHSDLCSFRTKTSYEQNSAMENALPIDVAIPIRVRLRELIVSGENAVLLIQFSE